MLVCSTNRRYSVKLDRYTIQAIECSVCGAMPGDTCWAGNGGLHKERIIAAAQRYYMRRGIVGLQFTSLSVQ